MSAFGGLGDAELWRRARDNDADAFGELFSRHGGAVLAFCARRTADFGLAEDLTSVVFLDAWRLRRRIDVTGSSARPLLFGVASNVVRNAHRSMRRHRAALGRVPSPAPTDLDTHALASRLDAQRGIGEALHALKALSPGERDVVVLVLWSGLSYDEAANVLGIPIGTVRSRVSRVRGRLRDSLASSYDRITQE